MNSVAVVSGLRCPKCDGRFLGVYDSRPASVGVLGGQKRRRKCKSCGERFETMELTIDQASTLSGKVGDELAELREVVEAFVKVQRYVNQMTAIPHEGTVQ